MAVGRGLSTPQDDGPEWIQPVDTDRYVWTKERMMAALTARPLPPSPPPPPGQPYRFACTFTPPAGEPFELVPAGGELIGWLVIPNQLPRSPARALAYRCPACPAKYWTVTGYRGHYLITHLMEGR